MESKKKNLVKKTKKTLVKKKLISEAERKYKLYIKDFKKRGIECRTCANRERPDDDSVFRRETLLLAMGKKKANIGGFLNILICNECGNIFTLER